MILHRIISGLILLGVILASIFIPALHWALHLLMICAALIGVYEYCFIAGQKQEQKRLFEDILSFLFVCSLLFDAQKYSLQHFLWIVIVFLSLTGAYYVLARNPKESIYGTATSLFGALWIGIPMSLGLMILQNEKEGYLILGCFLAIIFATDIGGYIIGASLGRHQLSPNLSPRKTIEGSIGGFVFAILGGLLCYEILHLLHKPLFHVGETLILGAMSGITSQIGDLVESAFKRDAGIKDSGKILRGHGGILDRIDSVLFTLPLLYLYLVIFPR